MILPALIGAARAVVGAVQLVGEGVSGLWSLVQAAKRGTLPANVRLDATEPFPLTHKDAERIAEAGRRAGHETETRPEIRPPAPKSSRYD